MDLTSLLPRYMGTMQKRSLYLLLSYTDHDTNSSFSFYDRVIRTLVLHYWFKVLFWGDKKVNMKTWLHAVHRIPLESCAAAHVTIVARRSPPV